MSDEAAIRQRNEQLEAEISRHTEDNRLIQSQNEKLTAQVDELTAQVKWFQKQLFGRKSERRKMVPPAEQMFLGQQFQSETATAETETVKEHQRKKRKSNSVDGDDQKLFFDESIVHVEVVEVPNPEIEGLSKDEYEVIGEKTSYRLAQRPNAYFIVKYVRKVIKLKGTDESKKNIFCPAVPLGVFEKSHADVSFLAGLLIDRFQYYLPLYRQHQRLQAAGIDVSRAWLTQLVHRSGDLLEPIFVAQVDSIRQARVKLMDETPTKAGRKKKGKMRTAYFWPVMGGKEIAFLYFDSRKHSHVFEALGTKPDDDSVIVSDGYEAYKQYAKATNTLNAQCWTHSRREFLKAENVEPQKVEVALTLMRPLWSIEKEIAKLELEEEEKLFYRVENAKPVVDAFFDWVAKQRKEKSLLPGNRLHKALNYVHSRKNGLSIFLTDLEVPIDTNGLERALRVIPMGRKNWLFCWTEVGSHYVGIFQSLIATCKMHGIDPYIYLVDVLQRVQDQPQADIHQLAPAVWKQLFADNPRGSVVDLRAPNL